MSGIASTRRLHKQAWSRPGRPCAPGTVALAMLLAVLSTPAAANDLDAAGTRSTSRAEAPAGRVFSRHNPLFGRQIPEVTPDRDGRTTAEIVPHVAETPSNSPQGVAPSTAPPDRSLDRMTVRLAPSAYERARRRPAQADTSSAPRSETPRRQATVGDSARRLEPAVATVEPVPPLPQRRAGAPPPQRAVGTDDAAVFAGLRQPRQAEPRRPVRRRSTRRRRSRPARWRRGAPPGTIASFVRCRPSGGCVRFYRVRRPRTHRQYRRLRNWQRRRNAAYYRARYRRR